MGGWRGSGGSGCRPLLREIWQLKPGEKKGRELEGIAESGRGFLHRETGREVGWKGRGARGHRSSICLLTCLVPPAGGLGTEGTHDSPKEGLSPQERGCRRRKRRQSQELGRRQGTQDSGGQWTEPCQPLGERPGAQGRAEGDSSAEREREKQGARPGIGKGPGGGSHADKHRDKLISSVYPGVGASSPAALLPFLSLAPE